MKRKVIVCRKFLESMILAGWCDKEIQKLAIIHDIQVDSHDISMIREDLDKIPECREMIIENVFRLENGDIAMINKKVVQRYKYKKDFIDIINNVTNKSQLLNRAKFIDIEFMTVFQDEQDRWIVENFAMTFSPYSVLERLYLELKLIPIREGIYNRYCFWFWDVNCHNQYDFSIFLQGNNGYRRFKTYINPLIEGISEMLMFLRKTSLLDLQIKANKANFEIQHKILNDLENKRIPNRQVIYQFRSTLKEIRVDNPEQLEIDDELGLKYDSLMRSNKVATVPLNRIFLVPYANFLRALFFIGFDKDIATDLLRILGFNDLPKCFWEHILEECQSFEEGRKMITENRKRIDDLEIKLHNSKVVRDTFKHTDVYDRLQNSSWNYSQFEILGGPIVCNREKRIFLELCLIAQVPFLRLQTAWKTKFDEEILVNQFESFKYYFWNLENEFEQGLYQYLMQDVTSKKYVTHLYLIDKPPFLALSILKCATREERFRTISHLHDRSKKLKFWFQSQGKKTPKLVLEQINNTEKWFSRTSKTIEVKETQSDIDELRRIFQRALGIDKDEEYIAMHKIDGATKSSKNQYESTV